MNNQSDINDSRVEQPLKALLEEVFRNININQKILFFLENFLEDQNDLKLVEQQLKDYDNLLGLVGIISKVFKTLTKKVEKKITNLKMNINNDSNSYRSYRPEEEYEKLEHIIQKHEAEIRNHISLEQQMKLYTESLQQKMEDLERQHKDQIDTLTKQVAQYKKDNSKQLENTKQLQREVEALKDQLDHKNVVHTDGEVHGRIKDKKYFCHSDHKTKQKPDYSSEYPTNPYYPQHSMRHSTPLKSQSQHNKSAKLSMQHRNSTQQDQDLYNKYNQLLKQHAASITQRSQIIQASQQLLKSNYLNASSKGRSTLNIISDICNSQQQKSVPRSKSQQGNSSKQAINHNSSSNKISSQNKLIVGESTKTNEAIQRLLKLK